MKFSFIILNYYIYVKYKRFLCDFVCFSLIFYYLNLKFLWIIKFIIFILHSICTEWVFFKYLCVFTNVALSDIVFLFSIYFFLSVELVRENVLPPTEVNCHQWKDFVPVLNWNKIFAFKTAKSVKCIKKTFVPFHGFSGRQWKTYRHIWLIYSSHFQIVINYTAWFYNRFTGIEIYFCLFYRSILSPSCSVFSIQFCPPLFYWKKF